MMNKNEEIPRVHLTVPWQNNHTLLNSQFNLEVYFLIHGSCCFQREEITKDKVRRLRERFMPAYDTAADGRLHIQEVRLRPPLTCLCLWWIRTDSLNFSNTCKSSFCSWRPWCCLKRKTSCFCSAERLRWTTAWSSWGWGSTNNNSTLIYIQQTYKLQSSVLMG